MNEKIQILNVISGKQSAVGFLSFIKDEEKMYIFGNLEEIGVKEDYKDLIRPYIKGMSKIYQDLEVFSYITVGGETFEVKDSTDNESNNDE